MNEQTMKELGAYLRWKRREKGKSLDDVVKETRLRAEIVKAMEEGVIRDLPAGIYARGMVKIYLEYLGANELLPQYEEFLDGRKEKTPPEAPFSKPAVTRGFKRRDNRWIVALLALAVLVAAYLLWQQKGTLRQAIDRKAQQATVEAQIKEADPRQPVPALPSPASSSVMPAAGGEQAASVDQASESDDLSWLPGHGGNASGPDAAVAAKDLEITAAEPCWLQVVQDGKVLFQGTLKKGETKAFPAGKDIRVRYGKPSAVSVRWMGKDLGRLPSRNKAMTVIYKADGSTSTR